MQIQKQYTGTYASGTEVATPVSHGFKGNWTNSNNPNIVETINQIVTDFFTNEVGMKNVKYEQRSGDTGKWIYFWDVPIRFTYSKGSSADTWSLVSPADVNDTETSSTSSSTSAIYVLGAPTARVTERNGSAANLNYNFTLYFCGNPQTGGLFRIGSNVGTNSLPQAKNSIFISKAINVCTNNPAVFFDYLYYTPYAGVYRTIAEPTAEGLKVTSRFQFNSAYVNTTSYFKTWNYDDKFPLVPMYIGPYRLLNVYMWQFNISGYRLPSAATLATEAQAEVTFGSRTFVCYGGSTGAFADSNTVSTYAFMGLQEVTEA